MKAYKCDRCGKLFEKYDYQGTSNFLNITRNPCMSGNCLDLCQNCNAELQEWVANGKEQEPVSKEIIEDERYHTCGRCEYKDIPFICHQCKWGEDVRKDRWKLKEELKDGSESE